MEFFEYDQEIIRKQDGASFPVHKRYLDRSFCQLFSGYLLKRGIIQRMKEKQLAVEIHVHAILYYKLSFLRFVPIVGHYCVDYCRIRAEMIDVQHGGDLFLRQLFYRLLWLF